MPIRPRFAATATLLALASLFAAPPAVLAQSEAPAEAQPVAEADAPAEAKPEEKPRRWLMREGSLLVRARGTMRRDAETGWWQFTIRDDVDARIEQSLALLPCSLLGEMTRVEESLPDREVVFEVTGQIYVYRGRNYLLPTVAPQLIEYGPPETKADETEADDASATESASDESVDAKTQANGDSVEDIIGNLESSVGSLARTAPPSPAGRGSAGASGGEGEASVPGGFDSLVREQTMILSRRGQVSRGSTGAWVFVFDADAQGLSDPPMVLMPCLLLEHLEQRVWRSGASVPVLISGRAYVYDNRNYLMPTAFQIAREQTPMNR